MKDINTINTEQLKEAVKVLNQTGFLEKKIKLIGVAKEDIVKAFAWNVEQLSEEQQKGLPDLVKAMYNDIFADEAVEGASPKEDSKGEKAKKAPKKKETKVKSLSKKKVKEVKEEAAKVVKTNKFASKEGTQAFIIDEMLLKGGNTLEDIARAAGTNIKRVRNHLQTQKKKFNWVVKRDGKKYYVKAAPEKKK
jgi:hypothetical protein